MNTDESISKISTTKLDNDDRLMSLDVTELFNYVPLNKTINIVLERIGQSEKFCQSNLTKSNVTQLLTFSLNNSFFTFNEKIFKQIKGLLPRSNNPPRNLQDPSFSGDFMEAVFR